MPGNAAVDIVTVSKAAVYDEFLQAILTGDVASIDAIRFQYNIGIDHILHQVIALLCQLLNLSMY